MSGKRLSCDHDGCEAVFPTAPRRGRHWPIRAEAEKVGWVSTRTGLYSVDDDADHTIRDFCPEHTGDLEPATRGQNLHTRIEGILANQWKSTVSDEPAVLTLEMIQAAIDEINEAPRVPVVERRGNVIYVDGVPTFQLAEPILTRASDWIPEQAEMVFGMNFVAAAAEGALREAINDQIRQQMAERHSRITDVGSA